jgi:hypothetical protein
VLLRISADRQKSAVSSFSPPRSSQTLPLMTLMKLIVTDEGNSGAASLNGQQKKPIVIPRV